MEQSEKIGVVIVAAGSGSRFGSTLPKQFAILHGRPVLAWSIETLSRAVPGAEIVVVLPSRYVAFWSDFAKRFDIPPHRVVEGGQHRFDSVKCGLEALSGDVAMVAVHDGARPLVSVDLVVRLTAECTRLGAVVPLVEVRDSLREITAEGSHVVARSAFRAVQTPQMFDAELLRRAYNQPFNPSFTDDGSVVEALGHVVGSVEGEVRNIKITSPEDIIYAEAVMTADEELAAAACDEN